VCGVGGSSSSSSSSSSSGLYSVFLVLVGVILFFMTMIVGALLVMRVWMTTQRDGGWASYGNGCPVRRN